MFAGTAMYITTGRTSAGTRARTSGFRKSAVGGNSRTFNTTEDNFTMANGDSAVLEDDNTREPARTCRLPDVISARKAMDCLGMTEDDFELVVGIKGLPVFRTEHTCYCSTGALVWAVQEFIAECAEFDAQIPERAFEIFSDAYKAMFPMKKPKERERLREMQKVIMAFDGEFADFAKSVVFGWQHGLYAIQQKRFLAVLRKLGWLTETGENRLNVLEKSHPG